MGQELAGAEIDGAAGEPQGSVGGVTTAGQIPGQGATGGAGGVPGV
jgi:hypothetical protein